MREEKGPGRSHVLASNDLELSKDIRDAGARGQARGVASSESLTKLDLAWNNINDAGARALAETVLVATSRSLTSDSPRNRVGDEGARALAGA